MLVVGVLIFQECFLSFSSLDDPRVDKVLQEPPSFQWIRLRVPSDLAVGREVPAEQRMETARLIKARGRPGSYVVRDANLYSCTWDINLTPSKPYKKSHLSCNG